MSVNVSIKGFDEAIARLNFKGVETQIQSSLDKFGVRVAGEAVRLAPADEGHLRQSIKPDFQKLAVTVGVNVNYAAYVEFGTRKFAAQYVATLPGDWQQFAAQFKGGNGDSFETFVRRLTLWVKRKGITGTYSVKTRKRTGNEQTQQDENYNAAYNIALYILRNGIKAQPFLYPAYKKFTPLLIQDLNDIKI